LATQIPIFRILGGLFFVLAGVAYYFGVTVASSAALLFVIAGATVVLLALFGHRARPGDIAIFVLGAGPAVTGAVIGIVPDAVLLPKM
jgi:hypothetical protein